ncbi:hypothetical protein FJZ27_03700 [Candidatus Peribacteria bacterium]|nr:hypothetical protein [Candidatus Peribacteria bacterium]
MGRFIRNLVGMAEQEIAIEPPPYANEEQQIRLYTSESLSQCYRLLMSHVAGDPQSILYPCCGTDVTPSSVFPEAKVTYVDVDQNAIGALKSEGYQAFCARVPSGRSEKDSLSQHEAPLFTPETNPDLLILLNPQISPNDVISWVRDRGYVICNNYHGTADEMSVQGAFSPIARFDISNDSIDDGSLAGYFTLLSTDEEYRARDPEAYREIQRFVYGRFRTLFPKIFNLGNAIPQYLARAKGCHEMFGSIFIEGRTLPKPMRVKPSNVDDLFLFQKKATTAQS